MFEFLKDLWASPHPGYHLRVDPHGDHVRERTYPVGGSFKTGVGGAGSPDPDICRGWPVGETVGTRDHHDLHLIVPCHSGHTAGQEADEGTKGIGKAEHRTQNTERRISALV